jgi:hypothetical protein
MTPPDDITPERFPQLPWELENAERSLETAAEWVEGQAHRAVAWYLRQKVPKARASRALRFAAIVFVTIGAAVPFVAHLVDGIAIEWGYLAFALAGASMGFDRYFGVSSAWMRYLLAELEIQGILQRMRLDRAALQAARAGSPITPGDVAAELALLSMAAQAIHAEVARETIAWAAEFQSNVAALRTAAAGSPSGQDTPPSR